MHERGCGYVLDPWKVHRKGAWNRVDGMKPIAMINYVEEPIMHDNCT